MENLRQICQTNKVADVNIYDDITVNTEDIKILKALHLLSDLYSNLKIEYPAYFVKGKNGPYINSIALQPENLNNGEENYGYYQGVYFNLYWNKNGKGLLMFIDGKEVFTDYDFRSNKSFIFEKLRSELKEEEMSLISKFL